MKTLSRFVITLFACAALASIAVAGPEPMAPSYKESKEVIPPAPPPCCDWTGFYLGLHAGGQFGDSESEFEFAPEDFEHSWGYSESGFVGGGQIGYNFQWRWLVLGVESDIGYMNLDGSGPTSEIFKGEDSVVGESDSDFYATFRGRLGVAAGCNWLFYATGGAIGVNYETSQVFEPFPEELNGHKQEFDWGYTVGGGIERRLGCHWSIKVEYLYFALDDQSYDFTVVDRGERSFGGTNSPSQKGPITLDLSGDTNGHILRGGLNFHF